MLEGNIIRVSIILQLINDKRELAENPFLRVSIKTNTMAQIPSLHVSNKSKASGSGKVFIQSRQSGTLSSVFSIKIDVTPFNNL